MPEPSAVRVLDQALAKAKGGDRLLFVKLGGPRCGACVALDKFLKKPEVAALVQDRLDVVSLDMRQKDFPEVTERLGKMKGGIPQWWLVTPEGQVIGSSLYQGENIGYPSSAEGAEHLLTMLRAGLRLSSDEYGELSQLLLTNRDKENKAFESRQQQYAKKVRQERAKNIALPITTKQRAPTKYSDQTWTVTDYFQGKKRVMSKEVRMDDETGNEILTRYSIYSPIGLPALNRVVMKGRMSNQFMGYLDDYFSIVEEQMAGPKNNRHDWLTVVEFGRDLPKEESVVSAFVVVDGLHLEPRPVAEFLEESKQAWDEFQKKRQQKLSNK